MTLVFLDMEVTGEHARTTLVSVGMVTLDNESLYITLNDYDRDQVTEWLSENVLSKIDEGKSISSVEALARISEFFEKVGKGSRIHLVSAGLGADLFLLFELWRHNFPERKYFHALHCLPAYLNHAGHLDLNTLFQVAGHEPGLDREEFVERARTGERHNADYDAMVVKECFVKLLENPNLAHLRPLAGDAS